MPKTKSAWLELRLDPEMKRQAERLFYSCGMTMSGAINLFLRQSLNAEGIPFVINGGECEAVDGDSVNHDG